MTSLGGVTNVDEATGLNFTTVLGVSHRCSDFLGDFIVFFKTCFRIETCIFGLGSSIWCTFLDLVKTL